MSFYIVPMIGTGIGADPRQAKYIAALGVNYTVIDCDQVAIVWANASVAQDDAMALNVDAFVIPPIDNNVAVAATQAALESFNIPAQWVSAGMTYRQALRVVAGMAQLIQRTEGLGAKLGLAGRLDLTVAAIPVAMRNALTSAADSLALDRTTIVGATTVREALRILGQQFVAGNAIRLGNL